MIQQMRQWLSGGKWFWLIAALVLGVWLLLGTGARTPEATEEQTSSLEARTRAMEDKIAALCRQVDRVGEVHVVVTLSDSGETVYAASEGSYVTVGSGTGKSMVYLTEKAPEIDGVGIVCEGGDDPVVAERLTALIRAACHVPSHKIYVTAGGKEA